MPQPSGLPVRTGKGGAPFSATDPEVFVRVCSNVQVHILVSEMFRGHICATTGHSTKKLNRLHTTEAVRNRARANAAQNCFLYCLRPRAAARLFVFRLRKSRKLSFL